MPCEKSQLGSSSQVSAGIFAGSAAAGSPIQIQAKFQQAGFRVTVDTHSANVKKKIRDAQLDLVPDMLVVGPKDKDQGGVSVRDRIEGDLGFMTTEAALAKLKDEVSRKLIRQVVKSAFAGLGSDGAEANEY